MTPSWRTCGGERIPDLPPVSQEWQANTAPYAAALDAAIAVTERFVSEAHNATAAVLELQAAIDALHGRDLTIGLDASSAASVAAASAAVDDLTQSEYRLSAASQLQVDASRLLAESEVIEAESFRVATDAIDAQARATALLIGAEQALAGQQAATAGASVAAADAADKATRGYFGWWSILNRVRTANIGLYGGLLGTVGGFHLLADAVIETAAVLVPASIALGAFGVAAAPTVADIVTQMKNLYTVTTATGQAIYPLSGSFQQVADAVRPQVYTLFGEALGVLNHNTGAFQQLASGAGSVLDQLGARFEVAITSGNGFNVFLRNAVGDLAGLGDIIGNLGGIFGHVFAVVPGYAEELLRLADAGSRVAEWAVGAAQPILGVGLALHGAWLYAGLGVTALSRLIPGALNGLAGLAGKASVAVDGMKFLGSAGETAAAGLDGLAGAAGVAAGLPWGWITVAAAGIGVLVYELISAKTATQQWVSSLEQSIGAAPAVNGLIVLLGAQTQVSTRLAIAQKDLASAQQHLTVTSAAAGHGFAVVQTNASQYGQQIQDLRAGQQMLSDQTNLYNYRVGVLARALGGASAATGLLAASGIKMSQMLAYGKDNLAKLEAQVMATAAAYRAMGQTGGVLGADMNVMNVLSSDQYNAVQKLNQAWGTWISLVTGGMAGLSQFETALANMAQDSAASSASLSGAIGSVKTAVGGMTYTLQGFGPAAMQSWQQFTSAVNQGNAVISQMRTYMALGAISNKQYDSTIQALVGQMIPFTQGNRAALTMLDNLAIQAGGPTAGSLKALQQWAGVSGNAARNQLARGMEAATIAGGNLSAVARALATTLNTDLTGMISQTAIQASGLKTALNNLASAMQHGGSMSDSFHGTLTPVIADLLKLHQDVPTITTELQGMGIHISQAGVQALIASGHLSTLASSAHSAQGVMSGAAQAARLLQQEINGLHDKTITVTVVQQMISRVQPNYAGPGALGHAVGAHGGIVTHAGILHAQAGAVLPGFAPGRDIIPALLSPGEAILNPYATRALGAGNIHWLNTWAERGGAGSGAMRSGVPHGAPVGGGGPVVIHNVITLDGQVLHDSMQPYTWQWQRDNSGTSSGLSIPGTRVG